MVLLVIFLGLYKMPRMTTEISIVRLLFFAARDDASKEDISDESHDSSHDDTPLPSISRQHALFVLSLLPERRILVEFTDL
jgi:hypothetical protein